MTDSHLTKAANATSQSIPAELMIFISRAAIFVRFSFGAHTSPTNGLSMSTSIGTGPSNVRIWILRKVSAGWAPTATALPG